MRRYHTTRLTDLNTGFLNLFCFASPLFRGCTTRWGHSLLKFTIEWTSSYKISGTLRAFHGTQGFHGTPVENHCIKIYLPSVQFHLVIYRWFTLPWRPNLWYKKYLKNFTIVKDHLNFFSIVFFIIFSSRRTTQFEKGCLCEKWVYDLMC